MLNDCGKALLRPWLSVQNVVLALSFIYLGFLLVRTYSLNSGEVASWVQAIGSIAAIVAAAFIPIWHARVSIQQKENQLVGTLRVLALDAQEKLWMLSNSFLSVDSEQSMMREYLNAQRQTEWGGLISAVDQIPIAELPPARVMDLGILREAVGFGAYVASLLPKWLSEGCSHPDVVVAFKGKRDLADFCLSTMPNPTGSLHSTQEWVRKSMYQEIQRPNPNPMYIQGVKVYRRYSWADAEFDMPSAYQLQYVFPNGSFKSASITSYPWRSVDELNRMISADAEKVVATYNGDF
jgi:hypothetical protein